MLESVKLSNNTDCIEKLEDIVGPYLDPPEHTLVLYYHEKYRFKHLTIHNLAYSSSADEAEQSARLTNTTTLLAALNMLNGEVLSMANPPYLPPGIADLRRRP